MNALNVDPWATEFRAALLPIAQADPTLITETTMSSLQQSALADNRRFDVPSADTDFLTIGFAAGLGAGVRDQFMERLTAFLPQVLAKTEDLVIRRAPFLDALRSLPWLIRDDSKTWLRALRSKPNSFASATS